jgi:pSer/pThr/pTyr-binding forkhead associated (FHA) protein
VCLEAVSGPERGKKIWLQPPQKLIVGRTELADIVMPADQEMSGRHFVFECDRDRRWLRDLGSSNGTYVNGERISQSFLGDGDRIRAGGTEFVVRIVDAASKQELDRQREAPVSQARPTEKWSAPSHALPPLLGPHTYETFHCRSGLWLYRGSQGRFQPGVLASRLAQMAAPCLVIDPTRLDEESLVPPDSPLLLVESEEAETHPTSPQLLCLAADDKRLEQLIDRCWSRDALICAYTRGEVEELVQGLQRFARHEAETPAGMELARLAPTALADFLANSAPDAVAPWLQSVDAVFLEVHQGDRWAAFSGPDFGTALQLIGVDPAPGWKS